MSEDERRTANDDRETPTAAVPGLGSVVRGRISVPERSTPEREDRPRRPEPPEDPGGSEGSHDERDGPRLEDCIPYDPHALQIVDEGDAGWLLTDRRSRLAMLDDRHDAEQALALARRHTHQCFIGRGNDRSDRASYIVTHWSGVSGIDTSMEREDLIRYDRDGLEVVDEGEAGWVLTDGRSRLARLDTERDARAALSLARHHRAQGFIGRGNERDRRRDYIVQYWALPVTAETTAARVDCAFAPGRPGTERTAELVLPGASAPETVTYRVVDGYAVLDGGIVLGTEREVLARVARLASAEQDDERTQDLPEGISSRRQALVALSGRDQLWESGLVRYEFEQFTTLQRNRIEEAIGYLQDHTNLRFAPAGSTTTHRVIFKLSEDPDGASSAELGRQERGEQFIWLQPDFSVAGTVHEILHAVGVLHEQSRNDRDDHVEVQWDDICDGREHNFRKSTSGTTDLGPYDHRSVMHYHAWAFSRCDDDDPLEVTLRPTDPSIGLGVLGSASHSPPYLSAGDIAGLRRLYPVHSQYDGGHQWSGDSYATDIAFGDVDGDGRDEVVITRRTDDGPRFLVLDDASRDYRVLFEGGEDWGSGAYATSCALADIDGDGRDEIIIGRRSTVNSRYYVLDDAQAGFATLFSGGSGWGDGAWVTGVAMGVDGAGTPYIGVARRSPVNARYYVLGGPERDFAVLLRGGEDWGSSYYATGIAFGDVDGDGELEVGVTRRAGENGRFYVENSEASDFRRMHTGGSDWGSAYFATGIAFGDVDGDGRDELVVTRHASENGRFYVIDDAHTQFQRLFTGGRGWGSGAYATGVALGDADGDGRAEIAIARRTSVNSRVYLLDDKSEVFRTIAQFGDTWGSGAYATSVALGNTVDGTGRTPVIGSTRHTSTNHRYRLHQFDV